MEESIECVCDCLTQDQLQSVLDPLIQGIQDKMDHQLEVIHECLVHLSEVQYGILLGLGVLAGLLLIHYLLDRF